MIKNHMGNQNNLNFFPLKTILNVSLLNDHPVVFYRVTWGQNTPTACRAHSEEKRENF